ncbi:unnamed protein product [Schistocephalus solidus]|uniref:Pecanex-like protein n=1 Tax=Schistocephalus solidus TaxID=70667 RepID=A0A183T6N7_SCHSO|nr:unnamed protein product [Schistocephalus solidus]
MLGSVPEEQQLTVGALSTVLVSEVEASELPVSRRKSSPEVCMHCHHQEAQATLETGYVPSCTEHMMTSMHESVPLDLQAKLESKKQEHREENYKQSPKRYDEDEDSAGLMAVEVANSGMMGSVPEQQQLAAGTLSTVLLSEVEALEGPASRKESNPEVCMRCHPQESHATLETGYVRACTEHMMTCIYESVSKDLQAKLESLKQENREENNKQSPERYDEDEYAVGIMAMDLAASCTQGSLPEPQQFAAGTLSTVLVSEVEALEGPASRRESNPQVCMHCHLQEAETIVEAGYVLACTEHMITSMQESVLLKLQAKLECRKQENREDNDEQSPERHVKDDGKSSMRHEEDGNAAGVMAVEVAKTVLERFVPEPQLVAAELRRLQPFKIIHVLAAEEAPSVSRLCGQKAVDVHAWRRDLKPKVHVHCHHDESQTIVVIGYVPSFTKYMVMGMQESVPLEVQAKMESEKQEHREKNDEQSPKRFDEDQDAASLIAVKVANSGMQCSVPEQQQVAEENLSTVLVSKVEAAERQRLQPKQNIHVLAAERAPSVSRLWGQKAAGTPAWRRELKPQVHVHCHHDGPQKIVETGYVPACTKHMMTTMHESVPLELQAKLKLKKQEPREENDEQSLIKRDEDEDSAGLMAVEVANSGMLRSVPEPQQLAAETLSTVLVSEVEELEGPASNRESNPEVCIHCHPQEAQATLETGYVPACTEHMMTSMHESFPLDLQVKLESEKQEHRQDNYKQSPERYVEDKDSAGLMAVEVANSGMLGSVPEQQQLAAGTLSTVFLSEV